jgi:hypothetical protein
MLHSGLKDKRVLTLLAILGGAALFKGTMYGWRVAPVINDISTDVVDAPLYQSRPEIPALSDFFKPTITSFYTDIKPLRLESADPEQVLG